MVGGVSCRVWPASIANGAIPHGVSAWCANAACVPAVTLANPEAIVSILNLNNLNLDKSQRELLFMG